MHRAGTEDAVADLLARAMKSTQRANGAAARQPSPGIASISQRSERPVRCRPPGLSQTGQAPPRRLVCAQGFPFHRRPKPVFEDQAMWLTTLLHSLNRRCRITYQVRPRRASNPVRLCCKIRVSDEVRLWEARITRGAPNRMCA